jgi:ferric-dicitrate binding protein FerR (iron transport regulator)
MMKSILLFGAAFLIFSCQKVVHIGQVLQVNGSATVEGKAAVDGMAIVEGALVTVNEGGRIDLKLTGGHTLRLKEGALRISRSPSNYQLSLPHGALLVAIGKLSSGEHFDLNTPSTIAGVRGTKFLIEEKTNVGYVCVCEGVVETASVFDPKKKQVVMKGEDIWIRRDRPAGTSISSPMMYKMTMADFIDMGTVTQP